MSAAVTWILETLNTILKGMTVNDGTLLKSLPDAIPTLYNYSAIAQQAVLAVGYTLLGLFFLLELWNCAKKVESVGGSQQMGVEMILGVLIKLGLCKILMDQSDVVMQGLYAVFLRITSAISSSWSASAFDSTIDTTVNGDFFTLLAIFILGLVALLITAAAWLFSRILIDLRWLELYVYMIIAPVPLATLPSDEWGQMGKGFLKSFAAICIQGTIIYIVLSFLPVLSGVFFSDPTLSNWNVVGKMLMCCGYSILVIVSLFASTKLANSICNAM